MSVIFLLALAAAPQVPSSAVQVTQDGDVYIMRNLIDNNPLYTFDQDEPGKSNCNADCALTWRPLSAAEDAQPIGKWTPVKRGDGSAQWAFEGRPVYSFPQDPQAVAASNGAVGTWRLLPTVPAG